MSFDYDRSVEMTQEYLPGQVALLVNDSRYLVATHQVFGSGVVFLARTRSDDEVGNVIWRFPEEIEIVE